MFVCRVCNSKSSKVILDGIRDWEFGYPGNFRYCQCCECGQVQLDPFMKLQDLKKAYPSNYTVHVETASKRSAIYNSLHSLKKKLIQNRLRARIKSDFKILDVGCGNGDFLAGLKSMGVNDLHGIDFNAKAAGFARKKGATVYEGIFLDYPAASASFDVIIMNHYLEHTLDPVAELFQARRLLKDGALLMGELPNFGSWERVFCGKFWGGNHVPRHTFQFNSATLRALLCKAGFHHVEIESVLDTGELAVSLQNWFQRNSRDLQHNPDLNHGRIKSFDWLLLLFIPVAIISLICNQSSVIRFRALT